MGVTLLQITELYRGSKVKSVTKFLKINQLRGYGNGSKYKKHDIDRIAHAMIYEHILIEESVQNKIGYSSDYVRLGENATKIEQGQQKFFVDFPKSVLSTNSNTNTMPTTKEATKSTTKKLRKPASGEMLDTSISTSKKTLMIALPITHSTSHSTISKVMPTSTKDTNNKKSRYFPNKQSASIAADTSICSNCSDGNDSDEESLLLSVSSRKRSSSDRPLLPSKETRELEHRIKTLVINWAEEERMIGKSTYYWNIISNAAMKSIAWQVPTTIDDLKDVDGLGENVLNEYGARIVRVVAAYVAEKKLTIDTSKRRPAKKQNRDCSSSSQSDHDITKPLSSSSSTVVDIVEVIDHDDDIQDEFDNGIDFASIDVP
jgi:superfamily II DNA helicase RecQ